MDVPASIRFASGGKTLTRRYHENKKWPDACDDTCIRKRRHIMSGKVEEVKGRAKEAVGVMTNNERLKEKGKVEQASGKIKQATEKVVNKVRDAVKGD
jgi:uncharacterized protein YjbJ (UPF0337 family)